MTLNRPEIDSLGFMFMSAFKSPLFSHHSKHLNAFNVVRSSTSKKKVCGFLS